jgi:hypothetical protein
MVLYNSTGQVSSMQPVFEASIYDNKKDTKHNDFMVDAFFHLTLVDPVDEEDPFEFLERVDYLFGETIVESYTGRSLSAIATFDRLARPSVVGKAVVLPLRLCTSAAFGTWLPLHLVKEVRVRLTTPARLLSKVASRSLYVDTVSIPIQDSSNEQLRVYPKTSAEFVNLQVPSDGVVDIDLTGAWLRGTFVRDLIVEVLRPFGARFRSSVEPVTQISAYLSQQRQHFDAVMAGRVIPRHRYGIDAFDAGRHLYYLPFDDAPCDPIATSTLGVTDDKLRIRIHFAVAGWVDVRVTARTSNTINIREGVAAMALSLPNHGGLLSASAVCKSKQVFEIPAFFTPDECDKLRLRVLEYNVMRKLGAFMHTCWTQKDDDAIALFQMALRRIGRDDISIVPNSKVAFGVYSGGSGESHARHTDRSLQGGNVLIVAYLNDVPDGADGRNIFYESHSAEEPSVIFAPVRGNAFVYEIGASHESKPVAANHIKVMVACEARID